MPSQFAVANRRLRWVSGTQHRRTTHLTRASQHAKWAHHRACLLDSPRTAGKGTLPILFLPPFLQSSFLKNVGSHSSVTVVHQHHTMQQPLPQIHTCHPYGRLPYIHPVSGNSMYPNPCFGGLGNAFLPSKHLRLQTQPCQLSCGPICRTSSEAFLWGLRLSRPLRGISHGLHFKSRMNKQK